MTNIWSGLLALIGVGAMILPGCGDDPNGPQPVSGTVTFQGKPLDQGRIQFASLEEGPTESGAVIKEGQYSIPAENGLAPGKYKVAVFSYDETGRKVQDDAMPGDPGAVQFKERIPAKYNTETTLTADVVAGKTNEFNFTLD